MKKTMMIVVVIVVLSWLIAGAEAQTVVNKHRCPDGWNDCTSRYTQAIPFADTVRQVKLAIRNVGFKGKYKFVSVDPIFKGRYSYKNEHDEVWNFLHSDIKASWEFGAYLCNGKIYVSMMYNCKNARVILEKLLRSIKNGKPVYSCPIKSDFDANLEEWLLENK